MAAGIAFGAYHFARPDLHPFNPVPEADHFVDTAQLAPGNILPVLDLERSGDLSPAELTDWVLQWLGRVTERTGVHPIVYTSPNGWKDRMADTTAIADAGYTVLWVAHWGVATPTLPANDWQGNGWTIWQYSNCGNVPGITGCVDLDWFDGLDFAPILIPSPDTVAPIATIATPTGVVGPVTVSFERDRPRRLRRKPVAATRVLRRSRRCDDHLRIEGRRSGELRDGEADRRRARTDRAARPRAELPGRGESRRHDRPDRRPRRQPGVRDPGGLRGADPGGTVECGDPIRLAHLRRRRTRSAGPTSRIICRARRRRSRSKARP